MTKPLSESLQDYAIYWAAESDDENDIPYQMAVDSYWDAAAAKYIRNIYNVSGYDWFEPYMHKGGEYLLLATSILVLLEREIILEEEAHKRREIWDRTMTTTPVKSVVLT